MFEDGRKTSSLIHLSSIFDSLSLPSLYEDNKEAQESKNPKSILVEEIEG